MTTEYDKQTVDEMFPPDDYSAVPAVVDLGNPTLNALYTALTLYNSSYHAAYPTFFYGRLARLRGEPENVLQAEIRRVVSLDFDSIIPWAIADEIASMLRHLNIHDPVKRPLLALIYPELYESTP